MGAKLRDMRRVFNFMAQFVFHIVPLSLSADVEISN